MAKPDLTISVKTDLLDDGRVVQTRDVMGETAFCLADVAAAQMDRAIREQLIRLGWTPPSGGVSGINGVDCVYTGAVVMLVDYNCVVAADLFSVGGTHTLIQWNVEGETWLNNGRPYLGRPITHTVQSTNGGYHHTKRGITVVDSRLVNTTEHARK